MRKTITLAAMLMGGQVMAEALPPELIYISGDGHQYTYELNDDGAVLTSLYPTARLTGTGASTQSEVGIEVLYLGKSCDAFTPVFGDGTWGWANGGFILEFDGFSIGFPRQEIFVDNGFGCPI